jgi:hypothetical protein
VNQNTRTSKQVRKQQTQPAVPHKRCKESSGAQAAPELVGHPRLPHSPGRCVFAAECGTSRARERARVVSQGLGFGPAWIETSLMTMQLQLQRHGGERTGCRIARRVGRTTPTTPLRRHSCRRSGHPRVARWPSRDPIGESGGWNILAFVGNSPSMSSDPAGLDCQVNFNCQLASETPQGNCDKHCEYACTEVPNSRVYIRGVSLLTCDDLEMPRGSISITTGSTATGSALCKATGGLCGSKGKCPLSTSARRWFNNLDMPDRNCSRQSCIQRCQASADAMNEACDLDKEPVTRTACKVAAAAWQTLCIDGCNAWCRNP